MRIAVSIDVPDLRDAAVFFGAAFGFEQVARPSQDMLVMQVGETFVNLAEKPEGTLSAHGTHQRRAYGRHWTPVQLDIHVDDFDGALHRAVAAGAVIEEQFISKSRPPVALCSDPFGHGFCLIGPPGA